MPEFTQFSNELFDAVLKLKCPAGNKELLFTIVRLMNVDNQSQRALSIRSLSKFLGQDKSNISKRLNSLIECNVLRETRRPGYTAARQLVINYNYNEWTPSKKMKAKTKTFPPDPDLDEYERLLSEEKMQSALQSLVETRESTTLAKSATPRVTDAYSAPQRFPDSSYPAAVVYSAAPSLTAAAAGPELFPEFLKSTTLAKSTTPPIAETAQAEELMDFSRRRFNQPFSSQTSAPTGPGPPR